MSVDANHPYVHRSLDTVLSSLDLNRGPVDRLVVDSVTHEQRLDASARLTIEYRYAEPEPEPDLAGRKRRRGCGYLAGRRPRPCGPVCCG